VLHVISLGAGVQSSTMALMAAAGDLLPMPNAAIFADTGAEPSAVYRHLDWLERALPFPVHRVSAGNLREQIQLAVIGEARMDARPPFFVSTGGMLHRQCTQDFKILPITRKVRELLGLKHRQRGPKEPAVTQWIGISLDEAIRMKPSRLDYVQHRWPLIEHRMTRWECLKWLADRQHPTPPKSACTFCPYHDDGMWRDMKANDPESWAEAVGIDQAIRNGVKGQRTRAQWFLHRSLKPLQEVDLRTAEDVGQASLFGNECEGMCGV
jgi:hypothetical protein